MHVQLARRFAVLAILLALTAFALWDPEPMPPYLTPAPRDLIAPTSAELTYRFYVGGPAVVTLSADQRELTVTEHARRDLLVCLRGDCRLVEQWLEVKSSGPLAR